MTKPLEPMRADTLHRISNAIKVANEFLEPFTDAEFFKEKNQGEFLWRLHNVYFGLITWLVLRRLDTKEQTFPGVEMVIDAIFVQFARFYVYKELPPPDWKDLKALSKTFGAVFNREKKFVGQETERFREALRAIDPKLYEFYAEIWQKAPQETDDLWKKVRGLS